MGGGALLPVAKFMSRTKIALGLAGLAAVVGTGAYIGGLQRTEMQEAELAALRSQNQTLAANVQRAQAARTAVRPQVSTGESGNLNGAQRLKDVAVGVAARRAQREATAALSGGKGAAAPTGPIAPASAETLRALAELTKRNLVNVDMTFVSPSGKLDPAFAELFGLTAGERIALQQSVDHARERLAEAEQANATVTRDAQGNVVVAVKAFAEAGGAAYDEMMKTFAGTLGTERYAAFNALGASRVESALGSFGAVDRTVTFSMDPGRPEGRRYEVRDNHKMAGTSGTSTAGFSTMQGALNWVGTVGRLVPADFGK